MVCSTFAWQNVLVINYNTIRFSKVSFRSLFFTFYYSQFICSKWGKPREGYKLTTLWFDDLSLKASSIDCQPFLVKLCCKHKGYATLAEHLFLTIQTSKFKHVLLILMMAIHTLRSLWTKMKTTMPGIKMKTTMFSNLERGSNWRLSYLHCQ